MKVSDKFFRLKKRSALFIISGLKTAKLCLLNKGEFNQVDQVEVLDPKYTDREGFFMTRGSGRVFGSGSVYEPKKQYVANRFLKNLKTKIKNLVAENNPDRIFLFAPKDLLPGEKEILPKNIIPRIAAEFRGNFEKLHPTELFRKVEDALGKNI